MANDREIVIRLSADGTAAIAGMRQVGDATEQYSGRTQSLLSRVKSNWMEVAAGATGVYFALQKIWSVMEESASTMETFDTLNALTAQYNTTAEALAGTINRNSTGLIGMAAAAKTATEGLAKGFTPEQLSEIAKWAPVIDDFSSSVGSSKEAFDTLVSSMAAGRERGLVQLLGASIDLEAAFGKQAASMSKAEKATALYNVVAKRMEEIQRAGVGATDSAADRMERFANSVNQAKFFAGQLAMVIGGPLMSVINVFLTFIYGIIGGLLSFGGTVAMITDQLGITKNTAEAIFKKSDVWFDRAANQAVQAKQNMASAWESFKNIGSYSSGMASAGAGAKLGFGAGDSAADAEKAAEAYRKAKEAMIGALSQYYSDSAKLEETESMKGFLKIGVIRKAHIEAINEEKAALQSQAGIWDARAEEMRRQNKEADERLKIEREITDLKREQRDMVADMQVRNAQDALTRAGGGNFAKDAGMIIAVGNKSDPYQQDYDRWSAIQDQKIQRLIELGATESSLKDEYRQYDVMQEQMVQQQKIAVIQGYAGIASGLMESANAAARGKNRSIFEAMKATQMASALISTYSGAAAAVAPPPLGLGPVAGIPLAALIVASGLMRVASIASQKFEGGSASGGGGVGMPSLSSAAAPSPQQAPAPASPPVVNIHVYGNVVDHDAFAREMIPSITKAMADGVR